MTEPRTPRTDEDIAKTMAAQSAVPLRDWAHAIYALEAAGFTVQRRAEASGAAVGSSERLAAAARDVLRTQVYEQPGDPCRGLSVEFVAALRRLGEVVNPALFAPDAERQRAIDRMNPEQLDGIRRRLESKGLSGWPSIDAVRSDIAALIYAAALPAAQEPEPVYHIIEGLHDRAEEPTEPEGAER